MRLWLYFVLATVAFSAPLEWHQESLRDTIAEHSILEVSWPEFTSNLGGEQLLSGLLRRDGLAFCLGTVDGLPKEFCLDEWGKRIMPYHAMNACSVLWVSGNLIALRTDRYWYTGGAHGNSVSDFGLFEAGEPLCPLIVDSLFVPDAADWQNFCEQVEDLLNHELIKRGGKGLDPFWRPGFIALCDEHFEDRLQLLPEGLLVHFNPYDVAAYAYGSLTCWLIEQA